MAAPEDKLTTLDARILTLFVADIVLASRHHRYDDSPPHRMHVDTHEAPRIRDTGGKLDVCVHLHGGGGNEYVCDDENVCEPAAYEYGNSIRCAVPACAASASFRVDLRCETTPCSLTLMYPPAPPQCTTRVDMSRVATTRTAAGKANCVDVTNPHAHISMLMAMKLLISPSVLGRVDTYSVCGVPTRALSIAQMHSILAFNSWPRRVLAFNRAIADHAIEN